MTQLKTQHPLLFLKAKNISSIETTGIFTGTTQLKIQQVGNITK